MFVDQNTSTSPVSANTNEAAGKSLPLSRAPIQKLLKVVQIRGDNDVCTSVAAMGIRLGSLMKVRRIDASSCCLVRVSNSKQIISLSGEITEKIHVVKTANRQVESKKNRLSPNCVIQDVFYDSEVFSIIIHNRGGTGGVVLSVSDRAGRKARNAWTELISINARQTITIQIATPGIFKGEDALIEVRSRIDNAYYDFKDNEWGRKYAF